MRITAIFIAAAALRITVHAAPSPPPPQTHTGGTEASFPPSGLPNPVGKVANAFPLGFNGGAAGGDLPFAGRVLKNAPIPSKVTNKAQSPQPQKRQTSSLPSTGGLPIVGPLLSPPTHAGAAPPHKKRMAPPAAGGLPDIGKIIATPADLLSGLAIIGQPAKPSPASNGTPAHQKRAASIDDTEDSDEKTVASKKGDIATDTDEPIDDVKKDTTTDQDNDSLEEAEEVEEGEEEKSDSHKKAATAAEKETGKAKGTVKKAKKTTPNRPNTTAANRKDLNGDKKSARTTAPSRKNASPGHTEQKDFLGAVTSLLSKVIQAGPSPK